MEKNKSTGWKKVKELLLTKKFKQTKFIDSGLFEKFSFY